MSGDVPSLIRRGLTEAEQISHPVMRDRHRAAWLYRLSRIDPSAAVSRIDDLPPDALLRARLLVTAARDRLERGEPELQPLFEQVLRVADALDPDQRLRLLNDLSELAIGVAGRDRAAAVRLLHILAPAVPTLEVPGSDAQQFQALGAALIGEALLELDDPQGPELLHQAEALCAAMPGRDTVAAFLAGALAGTEPQRATSLLGSIEDLGLRLETRLQVAPNLEDPALREQVYEAAEEDARWVEHMRGPEVLVRLGSALLAGSPERAREFFRRALEGAGESGAQVRSLQWTGVASALAETDPDWAARIFRDAVAAAEAEEEPVRRVVSLAVIADEMSRAFPEEAAEVFARAIREGAELEAMWELGHVLDVVFRPDRSPRLDIRPARAVLERILSRLSDEDPRIPGVLGLPEVGRCMAELDREAARGVFERWFRAARDSGDSDGMTTAGVALFRCDEAAGRKALGEVRDYLLHRVDCPAMGEFSRQVAEVAPDLVLTVAPQIPDPRERADAIASAAIALYPSDPHAGLELIDGLDRPVDRSSALLGLVDRQLHTGDRPRPQPLLEDLP